MSFPTSDFLSLIRSALLLLKEEPCVLASPEAAAYFRKHREKVQPVSFSPLVQPSGNFHEEKKVKPPSTGVEKKVEPSLLLSTPVMQPALTAEKKIDPFSLPKAPSLPSKQLRSILEKIAPELAILDEIPDDTTAKQISNRWKTKNQSAPITILSNGELPQHQALLSEIATALDVYFGPAHLIEADPLEKEKQWKLFLSSEELKLIVICDSTLWQLPSLRQCYREVPANGVRMLDNVPVFLLPDLSLYLKDPFLKRSLWKALCSRCS